MYIGVTGHQERAGIDWRWVADVLTKEIAGMLGVECGLTSLAKGSDQVFAECLLKFGIPIRAVIPFKEYESCFQAEHLLNYKSLRTSAEIINLDLSSEKPEEAFFAAGKYIADHSDVLFAVWDEKPAAGLGGTGDIFTYARGISKDVFIINPIVRATRRLGG